MMKGEGKLCHFFGLVRDGAAWDEDHAEEESIDARYMASNGTLFGNGKQGDNAGEIKVSSIPGSISRIQNGLVSGFEMV